MTIAFQGIRLLEEANIGQGDRWIYVADFNIRRSPDGTLENTDRINTEIDDLRQISEAGGITAILAHTGRYKTGDADDLDHITPYLSEKLETSVTYCPDNTGESAVEFVHALKPGDVAIMGNTRKHDGEEKNDPVLAGQFAELGKAVAVGGFGKAHRMHASNVGILKYLPGYLTRSQMREMDLLAPWAGKQEGVFSVAVLGGVKKEKITIGLRGFVETYDAIIPGGIVLNTILKARGREVGCSIVSDGGKSFEDDVRGILECGALADKIHVPRQVVIAKRNATGYYTELRVIDVGQETIPSSHMVVSYVMPESGRQALQKVVETGGRMFLAGTPDLYIDGLGLASVEVVSSLGCERVNGVVLGGDTAAEISYNGPTSTGGGSSLQFVATGTTCVFEALKENALVSCAL